MTGLLWNGTALNAPWASAQPYWLEVGRRNLSWGSPEAVKSVVLSLMRDGEFSRVDRYGNRVIEFDVAINAYSFDALGQGESVLTLLATTGRGELSWTPRGPGGAPETVWDVLTGSLELIEDTLGEEADLKTKASYRRVYRVTLECLPFARDPELTVANYSPDIPTLTELDDCSDDATWTVLGTPGAPGTITETTYLSQPALLAAATPTGEATLYLRVTGVSSTDPYIVLQAVSGGVSYFGTVRVNGKPPVAQEAGRLYFTHPGTDSVTFVVPMTTFSDDDTASIYLRDVSSAQAVPSSGTQVIAVGGSVRTEASLTLSPVSATDGVTIYTDPMMLETGFNPGNVASWAAAYAGNYSVWVFDPDGAVVDSVIRVTLSLASGRTVACQPHRFRGDTPWEAVDDVTLGGLRSGRIGTVGVTVTVDDVEDTSPTVRIFRHHDDASLLYVNAGGTGEFTIDAPSLERPHGGLWLNDLDISHELEAFTGWPVLAPPYTAIFVEDTTSMEVTYYRRAHTYMAKP